MVERANNAYQPKEPVPDTELFERAKTDPTAFGDIFERYFDRLCRYVYDRVGDFDITADMVVGVFVGFIENIQKFQILPDIPPSSYLFRSAHNAVVRWRRDMGRHPIMSFDEEEATVIDDFRTPESVVGEQETRKEIYEAIGRLTPLQQRVINLTHFAEMTAEEIAQQLNTTVGAVKAALHRARQDLKEKLRGLVETE